ncbi:hypothetical protein PM082_012573 [Marasmius tenuissimus]|nr:hypothetical protein PM082_012573 [Marasmius tenuissimus]
MTMSQPYIFTWHRDGSTDSDLIDFKPILAGDSVGTVADLGSWSEVGTRSSGVFTLTPTKAGEVYMSCYVQYGPSPMTAMLRPTNVIRVVSTPAFVASPTRVSADTTSTQTQTSSSSSISFFTTKSGENLAGFSETTQTSITSLATGRSSQLLSPSSLNSTETTLRSTLSSSNPGSGTSVSSRTTATATNTGTVATTARSNLPAIIGGIVGGVVFIIIILVTLILLLRRAKRRRGKIGTRDDSIPPSESLYEPHAVSPSSSTNLLAHPEAHPTPAAEPTESMPNLLPLRYCPLSSPGEDANSEPETGETPASEKRPLELETSSTTNSPLERASTRDAPETPAPPYPTDDDNGRMPTEFRLSALEQYNTRERKMGQNTGSFAHSGMVDSTSSVLTEEESLMTRSVFMTRRIGSSEREQWVSPPRYAE